MQQALFSILAFFWRDAGMEHEARVTDSPIRACLALRASFALTNAKLLAWSDVYSGAERSRKVWRRNLNYISEVLTAVVDEAPNFFYYYYKGLVIQDQEITTMYA